MNIIKNLGTALIVVISAFIIVIEYYVIKHFGFSYRNVVKFALWAGVIAWALRLDKRFLSENKYSRFYLPGLLIVLLLIAIFTGGLFTKFPAELY